MYNPITEHTKFNGKLDIVDPHNGEWCVLDSADEINPRTGFPYDPCRTVWSIISREDGEYIIQDLTEEAMRYFLIANSWQIYEIK